VSLLDFTAYCQVVRRMRRRSHLSILKGARPEVNGALIRAVGVSIFRVIPQQE
jgi:hypothetical protein